KLGQTYYSGQSFTASQTRSYSWSFKVPTGAAAGKYTLMVGVFTSGWTSDVYWNSAAASFTAAPPPPPPTSGGGGQTPTGLPGTFFIGLAANPNQLPGWVATSGVPWAMCYQYLSSGVTPGKSWATAW